jgi:TolB-like protein/DNA-binding winged helix-turn-helix (wHTH) protein/Flp pilus assembly protein TadD
MVPAETLAMTLNEKMTRVMIAVRLFSEESPMKEKSRTYTESESDSFKDGEVTPSPIGSPECLDGAPEPAFQIDDWVIDPSTSRMVRGKETVKLEPKVMDLLVYLAERPGKLVARGEIEDTVWAGVIVGYDTVTGAIQKLRKAFGDDARNPRVIETVPKKGYRLLAPVCCHAGPEVTSQTKAASPFISHRPSRWLWGALAVIALIAFPGAVLLVTLGTPTTTIEPSPPAAESHAIAVLPFENLSDTSEQEYFAEGITDDLITALAKNPRLLVIARDSSFVYKDAPLDIGQVAQELNARFILRGSVRRIGDKVRINAQLVDSMSGVHVWAEQYDAKSGELFDLQDAMTRQVEAALSVQEGIGEQQDLGLPITPDLLAYDSFLQGRHRFYLFASKAENNRARELFKQAIERDEGFAMAYAMLAWTHAFDVMNGWSDRRKISLERAHEVATKAIALQPELPLAYFVRGLAHREQGDYVKALVEAEKAIEQDPNYANAQVLLATLLYYAGRPEEGLERIEKAIQLNPHHPHNYTFHRGQAFYILGRYDEAIQAFRKGIASNPASERLHVWLAAALAQSGQIDNAEWEVEEVRIINPDFSLRHMQRTFPFKDPADREHFMQGLRLAGFSG